MRHAARLLLPLLVPLALAGPATAAERPVVIELFTSQSCSSCPPAEAFLGELADRPGDLLPLAFHVTYWNRLDWRDTFSLPAATERQEAYAQRLGAGSFTPQIVVDGRRSVVGSRREAVNAAIAQARGEAAAAVPVSLARVGGDLVVRLGPGAGGATILLVGFDARHETRVARGENAGRTLVQANVVRSVRSLGRWDGSARTLSEPWPAGTEAAVIVQAADGRILGAARS
ncbi:DUF1223 domain-containing protein [Methylobacterium planeticum]|uniref:DUF1223 domain-containing protein n=1 Tax=Methylobacterium planeticum TaxID=2615211 RepID=A0A6N6MUY7_9HYPH|nr:DUF1223 domain-containing protein [Methylobacterium planeticum]KAB1075560.1 DUF1223 domain-containing protein [Methylobacterium planeticum]